jgi:hypothetical protein
LAFFVALATLATKSTAQVESAEHGAQPRRRGPRDEHRDVDDGDPRAARW